MIIINCYIVKSKTTDEQTNKIHYISKVFNDMKYITS